MGDDGTKVEEGTHEELLKVPKQVDEEGKPIAGPGLYHTLWDTQQMGGKKNVEELKLKLDRQEEEIKKLQEELQQSRIRSTCDEDSMFSTTLSRSVCGTKTSQVADEFDGMTVPKLVRHRSLPHSRQTEFHRQPH
jgi:hypothetical protein